jgi:uncharacterized protein YndB with AHSA1/START domain
MPSTKSMPVSGAAFARHPSAYSTLGLIRRQRANGYLRQRGDRSYAFEIDARAGGWFYIVERRDGENVEHIGEYLEIVRPRRLVLTLSVEKYSLDFERVTVLFDPHGTGCELSLTHKTKPKSARQVSDGWIRMLEGLAAVLGEDDRVAPPREIAAATQGQERIA